MAAHDLVTDLMNDQIPRIEVVLRKMSYSYYPALPGDGSSQMWPRRRCAYCVASCWQQQPLTRLSGSASARVAGETLGEAQVLRGTTSHDEPSARELKEEI